MSDSITQLIQEQARIQSETFLWDTKVGMRFSIFMIEEYIENEEIELKNTKNTTICLSKDGLYFFTAHLENKERYQKLVDPYHPFIHKIIAKTK